MNFPPLPSKLRLIAGVLLLAASPGCVSPVSVGSLTPTRTETITPTTVPTPTSSPAPLPSFPPTSTPPAGPLICSPLEGVTLSQLPQIVTNPFQANTPGLDDGHHGTDLAFYRFNGMVGMAGLPIHAIMAGGVITRIDNRPPYGNAILIETPLDSLPESWLAQQAIPTPGSFINPQPAMNCPVIDPNAFASAGRYSLYTLYAHMQSPSPLATGTQVTCGQRIGAVGTTGESVNEHLHIETRIGPSDVNFTSMAYYSTIRTEQEAFNYCLWRVTNIFHAFDPMVILTAAGEIHEN